MAMSAECTRSTLQPLTGNSDVSIWLKIFSSGTKKKPYQNKKQKKPKQ